MRRWHIIVLSIVLGLLVLLGAAVLVLRWAVQYEPEFYREALQTEPEEQEKACNELVRHATKFQNAVQRPGQWQESFTAEEINGWLAVDLPRSQAEGVPDQFRDPRIAIHTDGIQIAGHVISHGFDGTIWAEVDAYMDSPGVLALRIRKVRAGTIPWSPEALLDGISKSARQADIRLKWLQAGGDPLALITLPQIDVEGGQRLRVERIQLDDGVIHLAGSTTKRPANAPAVRPAAEEKAAPKTADP